MKITSQILILCIILLSCKSNLDHESNDNLKDKNTHKASADKTLENKVQNTLEEKLNLHVDPTTKRYITDTLNNVAFQYQLTGVLTSMALDEHYFFLPVDTIHLLAPFKTHIVKKEMGGYLYKKYNYDYREMLTFKDVNNDHQKDLILFNHLASGVSGPSAYDIFINQGNTFTFSQTITQKDLFSQ